MTSWASQSGSSSGPREQELLPLEVANLCRIVEERSGVSLNADKAYVIHCRLNVLAMAEGLRSARDVYRSLALSPDGGLARKVIDVLLTKETSFFRNPPLFDTLKEAVIPSLTAHGRALRVWCAGCSTGQEPYSIGMLLSEMGLAHERACTIRATDYSEAALAKAREGVYTQMEISRGLPMGLALKYCVQEGHQWRMSAHLRGLMNFAQHNLLDSVGFRGPYDLILIRNVLIYFQEQNRARILDRMASALSKGGALVLGASECGNRRIEGLEHIQHQNTLYYRRGM